LTDDFAILQKGITDSDEQLSMFVSRIKDAKKQGLNVADIYSNFRSNIDANTGYQIQEKVNG